MIKLTPTAAPLLFLALLGGAPLAHASEGGTDWPQWRGPDRTGVSAEARWSPVGKEAALWTKELGLGHSSFAVVDRQVFTLGYDEQAGLDRVYCFDVDSGAELWRHEYPSEIWNVAHDGGTLTTPTVVGDVVYTSNREGKVFCLGRADGKVRWSRDLRADHELEPPTWGFSASPLVVDGRVILNMDRVIALDRATGADVWVTEGFGKAYSTPTAFELDGRNYLAVLSGSGLRVLTRADGAVVDLYPWSKDPEIYPMSPVVTGDRIFISAGYDRGSAMLRLEGGKLQEQWASRVMRNKMSGCVLWQDHLYGFDESILKCVGLDGKERWRERGMGTGSMTIAGGRLVILDGRGNVIIAEANPEDYVELSRQPVLEDGTAWSTPVLSHGRVFCRSSLGRMACLDYRGEAAATPASLAGGGALPTAPAVVARHVEAAQGQAALARVKSVRMRGTTESLINTVRAGAIELVWDARRGFSWSDETGLQLGFNAEHGWRLAPRSNPTALEDEALEDLRRAGDLTRLFDPMRGLTAVEAVTATVFDGRPCHAVQAKTAGGLTRTLYFEVESGLLAGHQGEDAPLWTLADYRTFDGLLLPTRWSTFEPTRGERAEAVFTEAEVNVELDDELFAVPEDVRPFLRTPAEIEADNVRLRRLHADLVGRWRPVGDDGPGMEFDVDEGFLRMLREERPPSYLTEPDEQGAMRMVGASYVVFTPERDAAGKLERIGVRVRGEERDPLERVEP